MGDVTAARDPWRLGDFEHAHTSLSERTLAAYTTDVRLFADWVTRLRIERPEDVNRCVAVSETESTVKVYAPKSFSGHTTLDPQVAAAWPPELRQDSKVLEVPSLPLSRIIDETK